MKNLTKKLVAIFLSALFLIGARPISTFAYMLSDKSIEALNFIRSRGIYIGDIIRVDDSDEEIVFTVSYLPSGENSQLKYRESTDGIVVTIIEPHAQNTFLFSNDGLTYIDGELTDIFSVERSTYAQYGTGYQAGIPAGCKDNNWKDYVTNRNVLNLGAIPVASYTANALAGKIAVRLGVSGGTTIFLIVASGVIDYAIDKTVDIFNISWTQNVWEDSSQAPYQYYYKYQRHFSALGWSCDREYYSVSTLL